MSVFPVDVNATFNTLGGIKPLYIRLEDECYGLHTYKIERFDGPKEDKRVGNLNLVFVCYIDVEGVQKSLSISYNVSSHKWVRL